MNPNVPSTSVMTNWDILPAKVANMLLMRTEGSRKNTLPMYSPTRFGIHRLMALPDKMAENALPNDIRVNLFNKNLHFCVSRLQLMMDMMMVAENSQMETG